MVVNVNIGQESLLLQRGKKTQMKLSSAATILVNSKL